tara:strand:- start:91 stop:765 length:675 start_codon:yes stop_codon:yes gene_type:complete
MNQFKDAWTYTFINWKYFLVLGLPVMAIEFMLAYLIMPLGEITQPDDFISFFEANSLIIFLVGITGLVVQVSFIGGLYVSYMSIDTNVSINPMNALAAGLSKFLPLLGAYLLLTFVISIGFVLLIIPGVYLSARFSLFAAQIMFENSKVGESISISWEKTDQHSSRIFILTLAFLSLSFISSIALTTIIPEGIILLLVLSIVEYIFVIPLGYIYFTLYKSFKTN